MTKEERREYNKNYYRNNINKFKEYDIKNRHKYHEKRKQYRTENSERQKEHDRQRYQKNKEEKKRYNELYYNKNKEKYKKLKRNYTVNNEDSISEYNKKYRKENIAYYKSHNKRYNIKNKERRNKYTKNKYKNDILFRLRKLCSSRLRKFLHLKNKSHTSELIGCSVEILQSYIVSLFKPKMTWGNYGKVWHIDHIIPLSSAKTEDEFKKLCHYTNLQPLWATTAIARENGDMASIGNLEKGDKIL